MAIGVLSAMADVADENELHYRVRQEGVMYAMRNLFGKMDQAIGAALSGFIIVMLAFPTNAKVGEVPRDMLTGMVFIDGVLAAIPGLLAVIPYFFYKIDREGNQRTKVAIRARKEEAARLK